MEVLGAVANGAQITTATMKVSNAVVKGFPSRGEILKECQSRQESTLVCLQNYFPYTLHSLERLEEWKGMYDRLQENASKLSDQYQTHSKLKNKVWPISMLSRWQNRDSAEKLRSALSQLNNRVGEATGRAIREKLDRDLDTAIQNLKDLDEEVDSARKQLDVGNEDQFGKILEIITRDLAKARLPSEDAVEAYVRARRQMIDTTGSSQASSSTANSTVPCVPADPTATSSTSPTTPPPLEDPFTADIMLEEIPK